MYCYYNNIKRKKFRKRLIILIIIFIEMLLGFFYVKNRIISPILEIAYSTAGAYATTAVNNSILVTLDEEINYENLVTVVNDSNGNIQLLTANSYKINKINREVIKNTQLFLQDYCKQGVNVPLGTFFGVKLFAGSGKLCNLDIVSIGKVSCTFDSEFKSVGINQTLHSIFIKVITEVNVIIPMSNKVVKSESEILICEAVLVGNVPKTYLNGSLFS